jgi:uncharacterized protein (TIGR01319 family)
MTTVLSVDLLVADLGSTKTMVSAFTRMAQGHPRLEGQGISLTSVSEGDVCIGLRRAIGDLTKRLGVSRVSWASMMATCSAAGGLRMAAHGLVPSMTSRAAREAALGAGAILVSESWGLLSEPMLQEVVRLSPRIVLLAGGVDGGETRIVLENARRLSATPGVFSVVYAGNRDLAAAVREVFRDSPVRLFVTDNVYPSIDVLRVAPVRETIHRIFENQLVEVPGMEKVRELVRGLILPTPGAVMKASQILARQLGDLVTVDVGGATTDVHSVTEGSPEVKEIQLEPEPPEKRTVEGDLGVHVNASHVFRRVVQSSPSFGSKVPEMPRQVPLFPETLAEVEFLTVLTRAALSEALDRHVGRRKRVLSVWGDTDVAQGKDLTAVRWVIGTGGALTRLGGGREVLEELFRRKHEDGRLLPKSEPTCLIDTDYVMAAAGLIGMDSPEQAWNVMRESLMGKGDARGSRPLDGPF